MDNEVATRVWRLLQQRGYINRGLIIKPASHIPPDKAAEIVSDGDVCFLNYRTSYFARFGEYEKALVTALTVRHEVAEVLYNGAIGYPDNVVNDLSQGLLPDSELKKIVNEIVEKRKRKRAEMWNNSLRALGALAVVVIVAGSILSFLSGGISGRR